MNDDIIDAIVNQFQPTADFINYQVNQDDHTLLRNLCQVSLRWLHPSRKRLYHTFEAYTFDERYTRRFLETVREAPSLGLLVQRVVLENSTLLKHMHLLPNVSAIWIRHLDPANSDVLARLEGIKCLVYSHCNPAYSRTPLTEGNWAQLARAWPHLETLAFDDQCHHFGPNSAQAAVPFKSLHTFQLQFGHTAVNSIPAIVPHTLRVVTLWGMDEVDDDVIEHLFHQHCRSLERFEVDAVDIVLSQHLPLAKAVKLQYFRIRSKGELNYTITEGAQIPSSLIELAIDLPNYAPEQVRNFIKGRKGGPLRILDIRVLNGDVGGWEDVRTMAHSLGIQFSCRRDGNNSWVIPPLPLFVTMLLP